MVAYLVIDACWIVFLIYWVANAGSNKRTVERQSWAKFAANRIPITLGAWLLIGSNWLARRNPTAIWNLQTMPHILVVQVVSILLCVFGLAGAIWARRTLATNWSSEVVFKEQHELVTSGPYRLARHPIYTSMLTMALGTALAIGRLSSCVGFVLMAIGFLVRVKQEDELMLLHFPEYAEYKSRVKALIPFVW
jgi:protein-S-isoprenylcysteine O-methyltransferase Ste14